jgi:hypothetical protein
MLLSISRARRDTVRGYGGLASYSASRSALIFGRPPLKPFIRAAITLAREVVLPPFLPASARISESDLLGLLTVGFCLGSALRC